MDRQRYLEDPSDTDFDDEEALLDPVEAHDLEDGKLETPFDPTSVDISPEPMVISNLLVALQERELELTPKFQRRPNLWDEKRKSRLIESILLRIPLPSFYFRQQRDGTLVVVDGLQRLCSIFHFLDAASLNKALGTELEPMKLSNLQYLKELEGKTYKELPRHFAKRIPTLQIHVNVIKATTPPAVMFNVFARLNQGGLPLTAQEIRNAIYSKGGWSEHIEEMVQMTVFRSIFPKQQPPVERAQAQEMVLRFVALWAHRNPFERKSDVNLETFLNDSVENVLPEWNADRWETCRAAFEVGILRSKKLFGQHAFRNSYEGQRRRPLNKALFETQTVSLSRLTESQCLRLMQRQPLFHEKWKQLLTGDGPFKTSLRSGTGKAESSNARMLGLQRILEEVLNDQSA